MDSLEAIQCLYPDNQILHLTRAPAIVVVCARLWLLTFYLYFDICNLTFLNRVVLIPFPIYQYLSNHAAVLGAHCWN